MTEKQKKEQPQIYQATSHINCPPDNLDARKWNGKVDTKTSTFPILSIGHDWLEEIKTRLKEEREVYVVFDKDMNVKASVLLDLDRLIAEVERLRKDLADESDWKEIYKQAGLEDKVYWKARAEKAEAKVKRLKEKK